jgi:5-oxoprolinase (ATP-hydrolysing) subunit C
MIEILTSGLMNSVQDLGRPGFLDQGIGRGGAMDPMALRVANLLAGNAESEAGIEIAIFPFRMRFTAPAKFSVTGAHCATTLNGRSLPPWSMGQAEAGDELRLDPPTEGSRAYVAVSGGIDVPKVLDSRATDLKSGFGGLDGKALLRGARLAVGATFSQAGSKWSPGGAADPYYFRECLGGGASSEPLVLRIMPGAEFAAFTDATREGVFSSVYTVSADNNRQGMRLDGPALTLTGKLELMSHGIMPGTIQVPPSGAPVIQLAEANTCGGYPKFAHVIEADLWKLAQAPSGSAMRFEHIDRKAAVEAIRADQLRINRLRNLIPATAVQRAG